MTADPLGEALAKARLGGMLQREVVEEPAEVLRQVAGASVSAIGIGGEAPGDDRVEAPGDLRASRAERRDLPALLTHPPDDLEQGCAGRRLGERMLARDHLE